ncbi:MAG: hypothetical protein QME58_08370 [Bacteroidota bacterium]|nr:hypothetical protein [Bacteroidota bacterium]
MDYSARSMPPAAGWNGSILGGGRHSVVCAHVIRQHANMIYFDERHHDSHTILN